MYNNHHEECGIHPEQDGLSAEDEARLEEWRNRATTIKLMHDVIIQGTEGIFSISY